MPTTLTQDLLDHIATAREDGGDFARGVLADHLEECGEHDRAEVMRLQVGLTSPAVVGEPSWWVEMAKARVHELTTRNPAWLSVPCPRAEASGYAARDVCGTGCTCNGTGDLLRDRATITRGFVTVTLPSALCWQRRCEVCGTSRWGRGDGCIYCDGACGPKVKDHPHPVLAAILASPVGIWVEAVRVSDREPWDFGGSHNQRGWWSDSGSQVHNRGTIPNDVYQHVQHEFILFGAKAFATADAANDALARCLPRWARARLGDAR